MTPCPYCSSIALHEGHAPSGLDHALRLRMLADGSEPPSPPSHTNVGAGDSLKPLPRALAESHVHARISRAGRRQLAPYPVLRERTHVTVSVMQDRCRALTNHQRCVGLQLSTATRWVHPRPTNRSTRGQLMGPLRCPVW